MNIAFLLGAGASNQFGIPTTDVLASDLLKIIDDPALDVILDDSEYNDIEALIKAIQQIRDLQNNIGLNLIDLEDAQRDDVIQTSERYGDIEQKVFDFIRKKCGTADYSYAVKIFKPILELQKRTNLRIFTTNYDMIIEEVCKKLKIDYNDGFKQERHGYNIIFDPEHFSANSELQLFKIHGSINWWSDNKRQKIFRLDPALQGIEGYKNLMIYPAEKEDYFNYPFNILQYMFNITLNEIDELIVVGHKFGDKNILAPIRAALERTNFELTIVNPDASKLKETLFNNHERVNVIGKTFEEWVSSGGITDIENRFPKKTQTPTKLVSEPSAKTKASSQVDDSRYGMSRVPYAKHVPEARGTSFNLGTMLRDRQRCPKCGLEFSVNRLYQFFNCPHCNVRLERNGPAF